MSSPTCWRQFTWEHPQRSKDSLHSSHRCYERIDNTCRGTLQQHTNSSRSVGIVGCSPRGTTAWTGSLMKMPEASNAAKVMTDINYLKSMRASEPLTLNQGKYSDKLSGNEWRKNRMIIFQKNFLLLNYYDSNFSMLNPFLIWEDPHHQKFRLRNDYTLKVSSICSSYCWFCCNPSATSAVKMTDPQAKSLSFLQSIR